MALSDEKLMTLQIKTLFTSNKAGRLLMTNERSEKAKTAPRFFLGLTRKKIICRFRTDLPLDLMKQLQKAATGVCIKTGLGKDSISPDRFRDILARHAPVREVWFGPAFYFPRRIKPFIRTVLISRDNTGLLRDEFIVQRDYLESFQPCIAVIRDGKAVSVCRSVRISRSAHEAGVETLKSYRGRGYAAAAVAGWALAVRALGRIPLYSTSWGNDASQNVARRLKLIQYGVDLHFS